jgi:hypothetical protein
LLLTKELLVAQSADLRFVSRGPAENARPARKWRIARHLEERLQIVIEKKIEN